MRAETIYRTVWAAPFTARSEPADEPGRDAEKPPATGWGLFWKVARDGVEPSTFRFSVGRSYQLSYLAES